MEYIIYSPCGNDTALVLGDNYADKKGINDIITTANKNVEQVGFLSLDEYKLTMAGGEFCGNATRCAVFYYLNGKEGEIQIETAAGILSGGIEDSEVWINVPKPVGEQIDVSHTVEDKNVMRFNGTTQIVISGKGDVSQARRIIDCFKDDRCVGVTFYQNSSINPYVWVREIDTFFNETACASGSVAVCACLKKDVDLLQPSGKVLKCRYGDNILVKGEVVEIGKYCF